MHRNSVTSLYDKDVAILKRYGSRYKLVLCRTLRKKGFEEQKKKGVRNAVNKEKLDNNISRAKGKIFEYAMCNDFEYFVTLTISPEKYDRHNLKTYYKDFAKFINNYNRKLDGKIKYVFIPEMHEDGAWHVHGLISGIAPEDLKINQYNHMTWSQYEDKFGYISMSKIKNKHKCASYMTKYVTKNMSNTIKELGANMYYCSKGLNTAEEIKKGRLSDSLLGLEYEFENDHVKIKWFDDVSISEFIEEIKQ